MAATDEPVRSVPAGERAEVIPDLIIVPTTASRPGKGAFEGRGGSEISIECSNSAKTLASEPGVGYPISARTATNATW